MTKRNEKLLLMLAICLAWIWLPGCSSMMGMDSPETVFAVNPITKTITYRNSKDMSVEMEDVEIDPAAKSMRLGRLSITSDASTVREANAGQMQQAVAFQAQVGANISATLARIESLAGTLAPGGVKGLGNNQMDRFWYIALAAVVSLYLLDKWRRER
jgi:hypothetical protein